MAKSDKSLLAEAKKVLEIEANCILKAKEKLDTRFILAVESIAKIIKSGGKVVVTGVGKSGKIAAKISATMTSTGTPSLYLHPTEGVHGDLGVVSARDALLVLSYSGASEEVYRLLPTLKSRGVFIVSIVGDLKSKIASQSEFVIDGSVAKEACPLNLAPTSSTAVALALGDALAMAISTQLGFKEEKFAENHPGGALGKRLNFKVSELMKVSDKNIWVLTKANSQKVVKQITDQKLGVVLVRKNSESKKIVGIITDGDIRRGLLKGAKFFNLKAEEIMTKNPITISKNDTAFKALEIMENRPSQINVLPVINEQQECIGVVRIHDLIGSV